MNVYDRASGQLIEEKEYGGRSLEILYNTFFGRVLLKIFFCRPLYSRIYGAFMRSRFSKRKIAPFIKEYDIDLTGCENTDFSSFDDFFTRKYRFTTSARPNKLISPCCGRLSVYDIDDGLTLRIKNGVYTLPELCGGIDCKAYRGGKCLVYRLAVQDCHRYVFCDNGTVAGMENIGGELHTVRPVSARYRVFARNHRICTVMNTERFGEMIQIEVGALQVGRISNRAVREFSRMEEKGFFHFGGSTIIQLFRRDVIEPDADVVEKTRAGIETLVRIGETVGRTKC